MSKDLAKLRAQIDALDERLLRAAERSAPRWRMQVGKLKQGNRVYRPEREAQVLRRILEKNPGPLSKEALARVYAEIISACRALEQPLAVSYLGPAGTFSEMAVLKVFGSGVRAQPCGSIDEVFRQAETGARQLRRGAGGEFERRRDRPDARSAAQHAAQDLRRDGAARAPEPDVQVGFAEENRARLFASAIAGAVQPVAEPQAARRRAHSRGEQCRGGAPGRAGRGRGGHRRRYRRRAPRPEAGGAQHRGRSEQHHALPGAGRPRCRALGQGPDFDRHVGAQPARRGARAADADRQARRQHEPAGVAPGAHRALGIHVLRRRAGPSPGSEGGARRWPSWKSSRRS